MTCGLFRRHRDDRHFQTSANDFRDHSDRHALFGDRVIPGAGLPLFQGQPARAGAVSKSASSWTSFAGSGPNSKRYGVKNDVGVHGEGGKHLRHPVLGPIALEYSAFAVDGRPDLSMVVYNPATRADADLIRSLVTPQPAG